MIPSGCLPQASALPSPPLLPEGRSVPSSPGLPVPQTSMRPQFFPKPVQGLIRYCEHCVFAAGQSLSGRSDRSCSMTVYDSVFLAFSADTRSSTPRTFRHIGACAALSGLLWRLARGSVENNVRLVSPLPQRAPGSRLPTRDLASRSHRVYPKRTPSGGSEHRRRVHADARAFRTVRANVGHQHFPANNSQLLRSPCPAIEEALDLSSDGCSRPLARAPHR